MPEIMTGRVPYVQFERRAIEDRAASELAGHYVAKEVDFALVTSHGSIDTVEREVLPWLEMWKDRARQNPADQEAATFSETFQRRYQQWLNTQEVPLDGTPIKTWPVLSPAEVARILAANVRTVEDLAVINEQGKIRIGMGAQSLIEKAKAWLDSANANGKVANEVASLKQENESLKETLAQQAAAMAELRAMVDELKPKRGRPPKMEEAA